jgi:hypothetical protein
MVGMATVTMVTSRAARKRAEARARMMTVVWRRVRVSSGAAPAAAAAAAFVAGSPPSPGGGGWGDSSFLVGGDGWRGAVLVLADEVVSSALLGVEWPGSSLSGPRTAAGVAAVMLCCEAFKPPKV